MGRRLTPAQVCLLALAWACVIVIIIDGKGVGWPAAYRRNTFPNSPAHCNIAWECDCVGGGGGGGGVVVAGLVVTLKKNEATKA